MLFINGFLTGTTQNSPSLDNLRNSDLYLVVYGFDHQVHYINSNHGVLKFEFSEKTTLQSILDRDEKPLLKFPVFERPNRVGSMEYHLASVDSIEVCDGSVVFSTSKINEYTDVFFGRKKP